MENIIKAITSNNLYLGIAVLLGVFVIFSIIKKLVKMILISLLIIIIYLIYLSYSGEKIPRTRKEVVEHLSVKIREGTKKGKQIIEKNLGDIKLKDLK